MAGSSVGVWRLRRLGAVVAVVVLCGSLPVAASPLVSGAEPAGEPSVSDQPARGGVGQGGMRLESVPLDVSGNAGLTNNMWLWRKGRRAFTMSLPKAPDPLWDTSVKDTSVVVAYDLDSLREVARASLDRAFAAPDIDDSQQGRNKARYAAVDEAGGRLFVPYVNKIKPFVWEQVPSAAADQGVCVNRPACLMGLFVLDAETLQVLRRVPVNDPLAGGMLVSPELVAMSYSPPVASEGGKVLLYVREERTRVLADVGGALNYVVQVDPDAGRVDWVARVEACRGVRQPHNSNPFATPDQISPYIRRMNEAVVFRGGPTGAQSVWVGCHVPDQTAVIVRIPLDEHGMPEQSPAATGSQESFIGPPNTWEFVADPLSQRLLLRVVEANPVSESWRVFDGPTRAFVGAIDIGSYLSPDGRPTATVSGLDPSSGRFYVLAPRTDAAPGVPAAPGGLFVTDVRATPVPPARVFSEFADLLAPARFNVSPIEVDDGGGSPGAPRRLLVRKGDVCCDNLSIFHRLPAVWSPPRYDVITDRR